MTPSTVTPGTLTPGSRAPDTVTSNDRSTLLWYALRTRGRAERQAALRLEAAGVEVFPALASVNRTWSDRVKRVAMPLFPGYIFARFALADAPHLLAVPGVVEVVRSGGLAAPLRDVEFDAVRRLTAGVESTGQLPEPPEAEDLLAPGMAVEVVRGPFQGLSGIFLEQAGGSRVAVRIDAIQEVRTIRMERDMVRPRSLEFVR